MPQVVELSKFESLSNISINYYETTLKQCFISNTKKVVYHRVNMFYKVVSNIKMHNFYEAISFVERFFGFMSDFK